MPEAKVPATGKNDRREIFGWKMYDWANSAFYTTVVGALFGPYLTEMAQQAVGDNGIVFTFGALGSVTAKSFFPSCFSVAVFVQIFVFPIMGAIADYSPAKKRMMAIASYVGVFATCLLYLVTARTYLLGGLFFVIGMLGFGTANVLYNSYLGEITTADQRDKVSSRGYAYGYFGGALLLALNFLLVSNAGRVGLDTGTAVRISLLSAGVWWGAFALITFTSLKNRQPAKSKPPGKSYLSVALIELGQTFRELGRLRHTLQFMIAYLFYNDGVQTVVSMASVFLSQELFKQRGLEPNPSFLLGIFLFVQFLAVFGALLFERLAYLVGTKNAILTGLVVWSGIVVYGYSLLDTTREAWVMAAGIASVLGCTQALSRSLFSQMIPPGREASFFGLYEVSEKGTSWLGPFIFGAVVATTNSYRQALLSLIVLFAAGTLLLYFTNTVKGIHQAGNLLPEEAAKQN